MPPDQSPKTLQSMSLMEARKLVLISQGIHREKELGKGTIAGHNAIEKLGYVQIDTISVIERAHHHTLWNRVSSYDTSHLSELVEAKQVFEYWSHAAAFLPMRDFRFSLPRKRAIASGELHWFSKDKKATKHVLDRIKSEGALQSKDFKQATVSREGWGYYKPAKRALEQLFMEGELMIAKRQGFQKVYDLTERVLPDKADTRMPSPREYHQHLIDNYLRSNGVGTPAEIAYLRKGLKPAIDKVCKELLEDGHLERVAINKQNFYLLAGQDQLLKTSLSRSKVKILSPFDNLLIQRKRTKQLFNFDYLIECYVPAEKRQYGYFCLPLLWGQEFAGRMDAKIDRKTGVLDIHKLCLETDEPDLFMQALLPSLESFLQFNGGSDYRIHKRVKVC
jgi:uncharacterized protein YcaQ